MTLLSTIQNACNELGIPAPATVEDATDKRAVTLKALARREQIELARRYDWPAMLLEYTFKTYNGIDTYPIPSDADKVLRDTVYNQDQWSEMRGSLTPAEWRFAVSNNNGLMSQRTRLGRFVTCPVAYLLLNTTLLDATDIVLTDWTLDNGTALSGAVPGNQLVWTPLSEPLQIAEYLFTCNDVDNTGGDLFLSLGDDTLKQCTLAGGVYTCVYDLLDISSQTVRIFDSTFAHIRISEPLLARTVFAPRAIRIVPTPTVEDSVVLEYKTGSTAFTSAGIAKELMTLNEDTTRLDENLIELGIKWRWLKSRGLDYAEEFRSYEDAVNIRFAQDLNLPSVPLAPRRVTADYSPMTSGYVPDRGYGP